jgi:hypothetical protein
MKKQSEFPGGLQMKTSRTFQMLASLMLVAFFICGQQALAQANHNRQVRPRRNADKNALRAQITPAPNLYALQAAFTDDYPIIGANADGSDLWPCLNIYQGIAGSSPDCPTLGNPSIPFPLGGVVIGFAGYVWQLQNTQGAGNGFGCDALINGTTGPSGSQYNPCGQIVTWYEDDTNDSTDDLLQRIVVKQGATIIYDSGMVDYGPAGPTVQYPADVILSNDANFGFWPGDGIGPNNGNCSADTGYPLKSAANPGTFYIVEAGSTCQEPVPGLATFTTTTILATPAYTKVTGSACSSKGVPSPCYTVRWTNNYQIRQDWNIFLE